MRPKLEAAAQRAPLALPAAEPSRHLDQEIVRGLRAGEEWATSAAWNAYASTVFRIAAQVLGSNQDAQDITHDVFAHVSSGIGTLRDTDPLGSFVVSVTVRMVKRELWRRWVRRILCLSNTRQLPEYPVDTSDSEAREALGWLYAILDQLGTEERIAFVLRHIEKMPLTEIAEAMGLSVATVKRRIDRAVERVAEADKDATATTYGLEQAGAT
jgi:RNA polymerase sigma-70 factor, ECF subfamily